MANPNVYSSSKSNMTGGDPRGESNRYGSSRTSRQDNSSSVSGQGAQYQGNGGDGAARARRAAEAKKRASDKARADVSAKRIKDEAKAQQVATAKHAAKLDAAEAQKVAKQKTANKKALDDKNATRDRRAYVPVGSAWSKPPPGERNRDPLERLNRSSGRGMQNQGDAFYPTGFAESLEDNKPSGWSMGLLANPMAAVASTVGKTFYNQHKYGMNKDAADLYKELIADPANEGKTVEELVQMARQPQKDNQLPNAFIHGEGGSTANEAQLDSMRPFIKDLNMSKEQWDGLPIEMKRNLAKGVNTNSLGGGGLLGGATSSVEPAAEESTYTNLDSYLKLFGNDKY
jgi:hypothetical protein|tara:strand:+ start:251 stop:1282 length:1032 start_codon:yes stop_codon:yes gene_type:complete